MVYYVMWLDELLTTFFRLQCIYTTHRYRYVHTFPNRKNVWHWIDRLWCCQRKFPFSFENIHSIVYHTLHTISVKSGCVTRIYTVESYTTDMTHHHLCMYFKPIHNLTNPLWDISVTGRQQDMHLTSKTENQTLSVFPFINYFHVFQHAKWRWSNIVNEDRS